MKKEIGPGILIAAVAVVLVIVGIAAFKTFFADPNYTPMQNPEEIKKFHQAQQEDATFKRLSAKGGRGH